MDETVTINGIIYKIERSENEIHLQRYNEKYKMWVNLYFPKDKKIDEDNIIETLSNLYIERNLFHSQ